MPVNVLTHLDNSPFSIARHRSGTFADQSPAEARATLRDAIRSRGTARTAASYSHGAITGSFPSNKMKAAFVVESRKEHRALLLADVAEWVLHFSVQAVQVRFLHKGKVCNAYPDVAIETVDGQLEMWECKANPALRAEVLDRLVSLHCALDEIDIHYRIRFPGWLLQEPRASNAQTIWRHADRIITESVGRAVLQSVGSGAETLGQISEQLDCPMTSLVALVGQGGLAADIHTAPLGPDTRVRAPRPGATSGGF
ncbi:hypothetical protein VQH23_13485 [Pararoseomonas sp. SCSIO 73927]|uniref:hypothetical protein n=1 Tax=Pararoseomonas sp. SCSIO 73927 TaxID=3114537 RepID=UPI0030D2225A